jgi:four helix bundle protein
MVWQKGMALAKAVYKLTMQFPDGEKFGLVAQMRRAGVSVPSNIAEGPARRGRREFVQFLSHAEGSLAELDTQLMLAVGIGCSSQSEARPIFALITELQKMITALRQKIGPASAGD